MFPDPAFFEDQIHLANRIFRESGIGRDGEEWVYQITDEIVPLDDRGRTAITSGTAKYQFEGRTILAEYMNNALVRLEYLDFGSGISPDDQAKIWNRGRLGGLKFELMEIKHHPQTLNLPDTSEIYKILKERASPNSLSTIELENVPGKMYGPAITFLGDKLRSAARMDDLEVEIYAAKDLSPSEKNALERRLARESSNSTVFIILNQKA